MSKLTQAQISKQEKIIVKDAKNSNIVNFIIPNGLQIGLDEENFRKGILLFSNTSDPANVQNLLYIKDNVLYYNGVRVSSGSSSSGGAPVDAQYLVAASNVTLTNEKVLTAGSNITFVDGGTTLTINAQTGSAGSYAPNSAQYVVLASTSTLSNERVLTAGPNISIVDNGANSTVVISAVTSSVIPTGSDTQIQYNSGGLFAGTSNLTFSYSTNTFQTSIINSTSGTFTFLTGSIIKSTSGITGSITKLVDGTDYIRAGSNVSIVTESNGAITISAITGSAGAPATDQYLVLSASSTLTNERVLTAGTNITFTDGGSGGTLTISATTASVSTYNTWSAEAPPTAANAKDDEFNSGTLSGWTFWDPGSVGLTTGTLNGNAWLSCPTIAGDKLTGVFKTAPTASSGNYEYCFYSKYSINSQDATNFPAVMLILGVDLVTNPTTSKVYTLVLVNDTDAFRAAAQIFNNYSSWNSNIASRIHHSTTMYGRIRVSYSSATSRTTVGFDFSNDGIGWYQLNENSYLEQYKHIGFAINNVGGSSALTGYFSFFRVGTASSFFTLPSGSMVKMQYA